MKITKNLKFVSGHGRGKTARLVVFGGVAMAALVTTALIRTVQATPPFNVVSGTVLARASFVEPVNMKFKVGHGRQEVIHVRDAQDTVMQQIVIGPGGHTGWHSHPGPAVALIKAGVLAVYSSDDPTCTPRIYCPGEAFVDSGQGHVHFARNLSATENVEVWVTYFDVPAGESVRLDAADPGNCGN